MTERDADGSPLASAAGAAGPHATEAFALLASETRLAILLALWEVSDPTGDHPVPFSELFERVDYDDPGSFNYHLGELVGHFVRKHPGGEGYELRLAGRRFVQAVIAGVGAKDAQVEPAEIEQDCPFCGAPTAISYRDGLVVQRCTGCDGVTTEEEVPGYLSAVPFDPAGVADRTVAELRAASRVAAWRQTQFMFDGLCPACSGPVEGRLESCADHHPDGICETCGTQFEAWALFQCRVCKNHNTSSPKALALFHPAVVSFYDDHGISTRFRADEPGSVRRVFDLMDDQEMELVSEDPPRVSVTSALGDDEVRLTFDESARVVDSRR